MNKPMLLVLIAFLLLGGLLATACSSDTDDLEARIEALEQQGPVGEELASLHEQVQRASMVATLNVLDDVGFHELNQTIAADEIAPAGTVGTIRTALRAVAATDWPDGLDADAGDFQAKLEGFLESLLADEMGTPLVAAALAAHDGYHDFSDKAWSYLADQVGLDTSRDNDHDGMDMGGGTPAIDDGQMDGEPAP